VFLNIGHDALDIEIGQMLMLGFRGLDLRESNPILQDIRHRHLGGVILFDFDAAARQPVRNIQTPEQVRRLTRDLQAAAAIPLLIAIDQEGGAVNRLKPRYGFPPTVSAASLGRQNRVDHTFIRATTIASTLADLGINLNFAPVVDLNRNPHNPVIGKLERSFSDDPTVVTQHARAWLNAHRAHQVLCALKHFPGHGSSRADSHQGAVDVTATWDRSELEPYARLIHSGHCDLVMTAHLFNARLDPDWPATLSPAILSGLLRGELGYDGVIISDDLQMQAIRAYYPLETAIRAAIAAGVDLLLFGNNLRYDPAVGERAFTIIKDLVKSGQINRTRIAESSTRVQRLKAKISAGRVFR
jgi:beta-N-acetylhexosaminidase